VNRKQLHTVAKIIAGQSPESLTYNSVGDGLPFFQGKADFQEKYPEVRIWCNSKKRKEAEPGDILMSVRAPVGSVNICNQPSIVGRGLAAIRPNSNLNGEFLYYFLKSNEQKIASLGTGSTFKAITQETLKKVEIPFPLLDDQIRIAHLLGKVEGLIAQRKENLQQLDELLKSVFLEMFGDSVRNHKNHKISILGAFITHLTSGGRGWAEYYSEKGKRFIRSLDVQMNKVGSEDVVYVDPPDNKESERTRVAPGDVLLTITGSKIGRVCFVPSGFEEAYVSQHVAIIRTRGMNPVYLSYYLSMPSCGQRIINKQQYGQAKPGLNLTQINNFEILEPKLDLQNQFSAIVEKVEGIKSHYQQSLTELEKLYGALSQKAFKGELDLARVVATTEHPETHRTPKPITQGFARQLIAAEILHRYNKNDMTQMKLQKLIHLTEYHAQLAEIQGDYQRQAAGPYDNRLMYGLATGLEKQQWFKIRGYGQKATYSPLSKAGNHQKYLSHWRDKIQKIDEVLSLLGKTTPDKCEIVSTLYAAWNDLLIDDVQITDTRIITEASHPDRWHEAKAAIDPSRWPKALAWMRDHHLVPTGYGKQTRKLRR